MAWRKLKSSTQEVFNRLQIKRGEPIVYPIGSETNPISIPEDVVIVLIEIPDFEPSRCYSGSFEINMPYYGYGLEDLLCEWGKRTFGQPAGDVYTTTKRPDFQEIIAANIARHVETWQKQS
jgi:hypothetical protein